MGPLLSTPSWQLYLVSRFVKEVLAVVAAAWVGYWLLTKVAARSAEVLEDYAPRGRNVAGAAAVGAATAAATVGGPAGAATAAAAGAAVGATASSPGGSELLRLVAAALTGPQARLFLSVVLLVNVARTTTYIFDGFISTFNPRLPNDWLDDLVRLVAQGLAPLDSALTKLSLVGTALFGCAVLLRWKDVTVAYLVRQHIEPLDKGHELTQNFINPASNLLNWVLVVASALWLATGLGLNLKPLLAVGGASGIIIGLATQQVLGNFVSGLNIFLARPFVAGEYISLSGIANAANVSGRVIRVDPMRTLLATEDSSTISVPNQVIAVSIVVNRSRAPHWSVGSTSPLLANPRELRWRMKLPHAALDKMQVRHTPPDLEIVRFTEAGAEVAAKVNLAWRLRGGQQAREQHERQETQEALVQSAFLALQKVVRSFDGAFLA
ncbi:hypothetical protein GPECTOR_6g850 [Gonium pectorale]|uniref:Mechanosensitive ion channel MscS domain-containing protein n=1 Tax=Gonium pectorale TaxID=33097 RepID=A0A150GW40_GONPE|nr:hypothetical protein GPECTOR_6g850 [Gonium pectorale]|eukprot:KXZ53932.1 hypothetical protein GPECTOR_6g850 [Gonium pectorale]